MRLIFIIVLFLSSLTDAGFTQNIHVECDSLFTLARHERHRKDFEKSRKTLFDALNQCNDSLTFSIQMSITILEQADTEFNDNVGMSATERKLLFNESLFYAKQAYRLNPRDELALEYTALSYAGIISVSNLFQQAHLADSVRIYAERILDINPTNDRALHILGRWHYEVANLGWLVRFLSKLVFGVAPEGNYEKAASYFKRATQISDFVVHNYWLGMSLSKMNQKNEATKVFEYVLALPITQHNDIFLKEKAEKMLHKLR